MAIKASDAREDAAALAAAVLDEEAKRQEEQASRSQEVVLPDDLLPGVGDAHMSTRQVLRTGGVSMIAVLALLNLVDEFDRVALAVLAPDIQETLDVSDTVIAFISGIGGLIVFAGAIPLGYLADRTRRTALVGICSMVWAGFALLAGVIQNAVQLGATRVVNGLGKANTTPVHNSLIADTYPIGGRARAFAIHNFANPVGVALGPILAGAVASIAGGDEGWRWAFIILAFPAFILALLAFGLREPHRGRYEQEAVLGAVAADTGQEAPISLSAAFTRLKKIRTYYYFLAGLGALGFCVFSIPTFFSLLLEDRYGLDAWERGLVTSATQLGALVGVPLAGVVADRVFRQSPTRTVRLMGLAVAVFGLVYPIGLFLPELWMVVTVITIGYGILLTAFVPAQAMIAAITPYRLRAMGYALVGIYLFLVGGLGGAIIAGAMSDAWGERTALAVAVPCSAITAGLLIAYGSRFIRRDISLVVEELTEEQEERERRARSHDEAPLLQVHNLDFSYGQVQVLFDVNLEIFPGEVLAILGTNGAGKSTLLRAISGLSPPDRGVVRLGPTTITYTDPQTRVAAGIVQVPGGKAVFPTLSVGENLLAASYQFRWDRERIQTKSNEVLALFPILADRLDQPAGTLSGGEQQMLAMAKALLLDPKLLLIDELSLGLAPVVVQELLGVVEQLKAKGITMAIVEQSVNVALALADRAIFMEKGQVRFTGPARELLERDDLVRAVFLGGTAADGPQTRPTRPRRTTKARAKR